MLVAKTCPDRSQAIKRPKIVRRLRRRNVFSPIFFLNEATAGTPRHVYQKNHANIHKILPDYVKYEVEHNAKTLSYAKTKQLQATT